MQFNASHKFVRMSPYKVRPVIDMIRSGSTNGIISVNAAMEIMRATPKRASKFILKVLRSAVANASEYVDPENLYVQEARVGDGPRLKRGRPRARGSYSRILKRMCHIWVTVAEIPTQREET